MAAETQRFRPTSRFAAPSHGIARPHRVRARVIVLLVVLCVLGGSGAAWGYIIFLKDGSQISAQAKYRVDGELAILQLPSGVISSLPLAEIDVEKTERENAHTNFGNARVIEGLEKADAIDAPPPPESRDSLADVLRRRKATRQAAAAAPAPRAAATTAVEDTLSRTPAGYVNLVVIERELLASTEVALAIREYLHGQGVGRVEVFQGTVDKQPLVQLLTESEPLVFKALRESAGALVQIREQFPGQVDAFELLLLADSNGVNSSRAGQFQMTPELADLLISGQVTPPEFFLRYVEF